MSRLTRPHALARAVQETLSAWDAAEGTRRLWEKDPSLWTGGEEASWLGWLDLGGEAAPAYLVPALGLRDELAGEGIRHVAVLGMGGSSLCPWVLSAAFGRRDPFPALHVLDSTVPGSVAAFENGIDPDRTVFVVASKSGTTLEPNLMCDYFLDRVGDPRRFVAITDPGSQLEQRARSDGFRAVYHGVPSVGGRFSALSAFGMVPAVLCGLDVPELRLRAAAVARSCAEVAAERNPGVGLGATIAAAARQGRDKLTLVASPRVAAIGGWLEQLVAESTGKNGLGIVPVDGEPLQESGRYGGDRLFVYLRLDEGADPALDAAVRALEEADQPVLRLALRDPADIAAQFFLWETATAVAGSVLGVNPFDQPDVESAKKEARRLMSEVERGAAMPDDSPLRPGPELEAALRRLLDTLGPGDYFALLAWLAMDDASTGALEGIRRRVLEARGVATTVGFGPRYLHSTGQAHKGGPGTGVFLVLTADPSREIPVPGRPYGFGAVASAQAMGDLAVLRRLGRRALRVHLGADPAAGLAALERTVAAALGVPP